MNRLLYCFVAALSLSLSASASNTWYVDINAASPGNGSQASPYTSIQYAINQVSTLPNDVLLVAPGLYVENINDLILSKPLQITSTGGPLVTELRPANPSQATVVLYGDFSAIVGFTLTGNQSVVGALNLTFAAASRCIVRDNPGVGVYSSSAILRDCTIIDNGKGIFIESFTDAQAQNTIIWANHVFDVSFGGLPTGAFPLIADYCAGALPSNTVGVGNVVGDPQVWDAPGARDRLRPGSPCIDAGDPTSPLDPNGTRHDIGAVPYDPTFAPAPSAYCVGKLNSQGCVPTIGAIGSASATSGAPFLITASSEVANKPGLLLQGFSKSEQPFQGGTLCIQSPIKRLGAQNSGGAGACTGSFAFDLAGYIASGANPGLAPGAVVDCQWWSRDPLDAAGFGSGLSNAMSFGIAP